MKYNLLSSQKQQLSHKKTKIATIQTIFFINIKRQILYNKKMVDRVCIFLRFFVQEKKIKYNYCIYLVYSLSPITIYHETTHTIFIIPHSECYHALRLTPCCYRSVCQRTKSQYLFQRS